MLTTLMLLALAPVAIVWLLPAASELLMLLIAARRPASDPPTRSASASRLLILVPAHDEERLIGRCVRSLMEMTSHRAVASIVVIADNCSDQTAGIAESLGARVLQRRDTTRRGKPAAIEWAFGQLPLADFDAAVIIDADTEVDPGFADALAEYAPLRDIAVQAYFGVSNLHDSWLSTLGVLLSKVRYEGQYPLKRRARLNCPLTGNGMCLGANLLRRAGWPADSLTENWDLYARYTAAGEVIAYARQALLAAHEESSLATSSTQRQRWQAGRWHVLREYARSLWRSRRVGIPQKIDAFAELSDPGPVLRAVVAFVLGAVCLTVGGLAGRVMGVAFLLSLLPMAFWTIRAWWGLPHRTQTLLALASLPWYAVWRVMVGGRALAVGRHAPWVRSPR
jgi:cellulose synthase/poly-beta-1,6-N-acetylglucosamine synthase-like glycosyltransferase